jgi:multidrug efflux pump subunit AcrA (membrane-fusion protein)
MIRDLLGRRPVQAGVAAVVLALSGWWGWGALRGDENGAWVRVERDDLVLGVEVTGTLRAADTSSLGPPQIPWIWDYKISMIGPEGSDVAEGQPVLAFDASELTRELKTYQAQAQEASKEIEKKEAEIALIRQQNELRLAEAEARLRKARVMVDVPGDLTSENELREAVLDLALVEKEIAYLQKKLADATSADQGVLNAMHARRRRAEDEVVDIQDAIESMIVKAPRDGTVIYVSNWRDEKKKIGDSCWRGEKVVEIPNLSLMVADAEVDEADAAMVSVGQRLSFRLDAHPDDWFHGTVGNIWGSVQRKSWRTPLKVVRLDVDLDSTDERRMRPGMRFRGEIEIERIENALLIPIEAIFGGEHGPMVFVKTLVGYSRVSVRLGRRNEETVEVLEGLDDGDRVSTVDPSLAGKEART